MSMGDRDVDSAVLTMYNLKQDAPSALRCPDSPIRRAAPR